MHDDVHIRTHVHELEGRKDGLARVLSAAVLSPTHSHTFVEFSCGIQEAVGQSLCYVVSLRCFGPKRGGGGETPMRGRG